MPRTPTRSPARPDLNALPDPLRLPWRPPGAPDSPARVPDARAEPGWAAGLPEAGAVDRRLIEAEIGREVRGSVAVAARCRYGLPAVVRTAPLLPDGTPFPTLYWLACPAARVAVGRLEAAGWNATLSERVAAEPDLAAAHAAAHASYLAQRDAMAHLPGDPGVGGLPGRVKCLHALYAHQAATGADPVGRIVSQAGRGAAVGGGRLGLAGQDLGVHAEQVADAVEEHLAVGRVPGGAGRDQPATLDTEAPAGLGVAGQHLEGPVQRRRVEPSGAVHALAEPGDHHLPGVLGHDLAAVGVGHQQPGRVGPHIQSGQPRHQLPGSTQGPGQSMGSTAWLTMPPTGLAPVAAWWA